MAPNHSYILTDASGEPVSRTYQYRKVMKPMLERKRRARINRCLDELKELMTGALQTVRLNFYCIFVKFVRFNAFRSFIVANEIDYHWLCNLPFNILNIN